MARKAFLIDTTRCTACRSCQVACKQWNKLPAEATVNRGSYENPPDLTPHLYNQIHFIEQGQGSDLRWLFVNKRCMPVSYTHLRAHETVLDLVCRLLLEK